MEDEKKLKNRDDNDEKLQDNDNDEMELDIEMARKIQNEEMLMTVWCWKL